MNIESEYLQKAVGGPLLDGLSATVLASPPDPVKYLAEYLLSYRQNALRANELREKEKLASEQMKELEQQRLADLQQRKDDLIQKKKQLEEDRKQEIARQSEFPDFLVKRRAQLEEERIMNDPVLRNQRIYDKVVEGLSELSSALLLELRRMDTADPATHRIMKGVFYTLGHQPSDMTTWMGVRQLITGTLFASLISFKPDDRSTKQTFERAGHTIEDLEGADIAKFELNEAVQVMYDWLKVVIPLHIAHVEKKVEEAVENDISVEDVDDEDEADLAQHEDKSTLPPLE
ncbi:hypothetical protein PCE1_004383 [Barthelona sp. PCE]